MPTFALAGAGWMARIHALALEAAGLRVGRCPVTVVASRSPEGAQRFADDHDARVVSVEELPAGAEVVIVATPPAHHLRPTLVAAASGAAVLVEKPLCTTLADADALVRVADAGAMITYAENLLFAPAVGAALAEIRSLGAVGHCSVHIAQPAPSWGSYQERSAGGGVLLDLGIHALALVLRAAGTDEPTGVRATFEMPAGAEVEDRAQVTVEFASGMSAAVDVSWRETIPTWNLQAASERGVVYLELLPHLHLERSGETVELQRSSESSAAPPQLDDFGYVDQICEVVYALRAERAVAASSVHLGRQALEIVCAAATSAAAGGERVSLPFTGRRDRSPIELFHPERSAGGIDPGDDPTSR